MKKFIVIFLIIVILHTKCYAAENLENVYNQLGIYEIFDLRPEIFPEFDIVTLLDTLKNGKVFDIKVVLSELSEYIIAVFTSHYRVLILLVVCGFVVSITNILKNESKSINETVFNISYISYAIIIIFIFTNCIHPTKELFDDMVLMIKSFIPVLLTLLNFSGGVTSSTMISSLLLMMIEILTNIINIIVFPLITASVTVSVANNMSRKINIGTMVTLMRQGVKWILGFCLAIYTGFYSIYGLVGSTLDNRIGKAARFALGRGIPVVGGVVAESIETVMTTFGAVRNITGSVGVIFISLYCVAPMIKTFIYILIFKLAAMVLEPISDSRIVALTSETAEAMTLILSVLIAVCLLFVGCIGIILITGNFIN